MTSDENTRPIDSQVRIGHVHLKVADLERSLRFYCDVLGFQLTQRYGDQAAFVSAGGYHHHIGLKGNTLTRKGLDAVMLHGEKFIEERLAPANPPNDGKQTPMRNHPIFVAQHGTATCCRGCLEKWHSIPKGHALTPEEKAYILSILRRWLISQGAA